MTPLFALEIVVCGGVGRCMVSVVTICVLSACFCCCGRLVVCRCLTLCTALFRGLFVRCLRWIVVILSRGLDVCCSLVLCGDFMISDFF